MIAVVACMLICRLLRITAGQRLGMALAGSFVFVPGDEEWAAGAAELRDLFAAVEALSLVASGLTRADVALDPAAHH